MTWLIWLRSSASEIATRSFCWLSGAVAPRIVMTSSPYIVVTSLLAGLCVCERRLGGSPNAMSSWPDSTSARAEFGSGFVSKEIDGTVGLGPQKALFTVNVGVLLPPQ